MNATTINDAQTIGGGPDSALGRIDQYELVRELGGGGFGTVYLAKDTVAGIEVAVKGLPPVIKSNAEEIERIRENFALVSRLHHPYIAAALHLQLARDVRYNDEAAREKLRVMPGDTLMVMEYAPGVTLSKWRRQFPGRKVPLEQAVQLVWQIAQALDYAHEQHILHRDVKPSNIMVETKPDGEVVARLLDFGLAAEIRSSVSRVSQEVRDTSGTRPYMAPEQWAGRKQGPATDQYALAALLCELLTGEVPFASVFETGDPVVMMTAVCNRDVELPAGCPRQAALRRALAKDPARRFASCMEFVEEVAKSERVAPTGAGRASPPRGRKPHVPQEAAKRVGAAPRAMAAKIGRDGFDRWHATRVPATWVYAGSLMLAIIAAVGSVCWYSHRRKQAEFARRQARIAAIQQEEREQARKAELARKAEIELKAEIERKARMREEEARKQREREMEKKRLAEEVAKREREQERLREAEAARRAADEKRRREREFNTASENLMEECVSAREVAVQAEARDFAKDEFIEADRLLSKTKRLDVSTEKGKADYLEGLKDAKGAFEKATEVAERNSRPTVHLTASFNGAEKTAKITSGIDNPGMTTPITIDAGNSMLGSTITFEVEYSEDGVEYEGAVEYRVEKGRQNMDVELTPKFTLPPNIQHCRHCGASLSQYSRNSKLCPICGRNLLY